MTTSLFERAGGFAAVRKVVSAFYDKVLDHEHLSTYFADSDMRTLIDHQTQFISAILGGPASYSDDVIRRVHAPMGIPRSDYREMASLIQETFEDFGFADEDVEFVHKEVMSRESLIVTKYD